MLNDVRKKSREKIKTPISMKSLIDKKGIDISQIDNKINDNISNSGNYDIFQNFLKEQGIEYIDICRLSAAKMLHDARWLDINDLKYQEIVVVLRKIIATYVESFDTNVFNNDLKDKCIQELERKGLLSDSLDEMLIEVLYYERKFSTRNKEGTKV